jgi:hypothetical protein
VLRRLDRLGLAMSFLRYFLWLMAACIVIYVLMTALGYTYVG